MTYEVNTDLKTITIKGEFKFSDIKELHEKYKDFSFTCETQYYNIPTYTPNRLGWWETPIVTCNKL